jgi:sugar transferase (PEP-CTERM/EpsH1 system associated)
MKILFITSRFPFPLEKGDKLRAFHFIKYLSRTYEVHLLALSDCQVEEEWKNRLQPYCQSITVERLHKFQIAWNIFSAAFTKLPFQVSYFTSKRAATTLLQLQRELQPNVIFFHLIRTAELAHVVKNSAKIIDYMDAFSIGVKRRKTAAPFFTRWLWNWEYQKVLKYECRVFNYFHAHTIISEQDRNFLPVEKKKLITVIPNGIEIPKPLGLEKKFDIIFAGNMSYPPNIEAVIFLVKKVMPLVWKEIPQAQVVVAGAQPALSVQHLASKNVVVTGWVDSIQEYFFKSKILVAPMLISIGLQNKLLEAMAAGLPCVTTPLANNALQAKPDEEILVAETPEQFSKHIVNLLQNSHLYETISVQGHRFVLQNYTWQKVAENLNYIIEKTAKSHS